MFAIFRISIPFVLLLSFFSSAVYAQQADSTVGTGKRDTSRLDFVGRFKKLGTEEAVRSINTYEKGRLSIHQRKVVDLIDKTSQQLKIYLKKGIDTLGIIEELKTTRSSLDIVREGVFVNKGTVQTQRNLTVSSAILTELVARIHRRRLQLETYATDLVNYRDRIDSLSSDTAIYSFPDDSLKLLKYLQKISVVANELRPLDSTLNLAVNNVLDLKTKVDVMEFELNTALEDVELYRTQLSSGNFDREFSNIWGPVGFSRPFGEILQFSRAKERLALNFYISDNKGKLLFLFVMIALVTFFLGSLKQRVHKNGNLDPLFKDKLVIKYPFLSALVINLSIFQFIFYDPPFIFSFWFWLISAIALAFMFRKYITTFWVNFWIIMIALFVLASADNLLLQASRMERWLMLGLSVFGIIYGSYILWSDRKNELKEKRILYAIGFVVVLQIAAAFFNIFGRFNLSKTLMATGYVGLVIAILFLWTIRLINEGLRIASEIYKHPDKKLFYINFDKVGERVPGIFYALLVLGWFILIARNFYAFKLLTGPVYDFITTERTVGDYSFTISGLSIFLLILICSLILSKIVSFFASDPVETHSQESNSTKVGLGSWLLLVRIFIISMGLFLALAAAGIPLDKITIILGALGVGIGLGLQSLVNNLVSGLIIAFEKPVNVGDMIEINGKPGKMKSIGFRSSVVTLADGAALIIPNGDLLSQHLVNWSVGKNIKRISFPVGVAYGSDLDKVKTILMGILSDHEKILKSPLPEVVADQFSQNAINFEIQFWVRHVREAQQIKGDIIAKIDRTFKQEGIIIPIPQHEVRVKYINKPEGEK